MTRSRAWWCIPPMVIGGALAIWLAASDAGPARTHSIPPSLAVRVAVLAPQDIRPAAQVWGNIRAAESWAAVAEVRGQIVWRHPDLESGRLIPAGTRVLEIDPGEYRLAIAQAEADLAVQHAEASQIEVEAANTERILRLEEARLAMATADLERIRGLVPLGVAPRTRADEAERVELQARRVVVELGNALALLAPRRDRLAAQVARTEAALARARRDLANTVITTPFDLRITAVPVQRFQFVTVGQPLAAGDGIARAEVVAQVPLPAVQRLLAAVEVPPGTDRMGTLRADPGAWIEAELRLVADRSQVWRGRVTRMEPALDPRARTAPVVVEVADPYAGADPPLRAPLLPNMQVEVTLTGRRIPAQMVIPETALRGEVVHLADAEDRLLLRPVTVWFRQGAEIVIASGLQPGERLVLDDIAPALPGLRLLPVVSIP